jgi:hypothetical protein
LFRKIFLDVREKITEFRSMEATDQESVTGLTPMETTQDMKSRRTSSVISGGAKATDHESDIGLTPMSTIRSSESGITSPVLSGYEVSVGRMMTIFVAAGPGVVATSPAL